MKVKRMILILLLVTGSSPMHARGSAIARKLFFRILAAFATIGVGINGAVFGTLMRDS